MTGLDGTYQFRDIQPGRYTVTASKPSFVSLSFGQTRTTETARSIEVVGNESIERVDMRLPRGGIITGTVLDELGEPVPEMQVTALRQQFVAGKRRLVPVGRPTTTDDIGGYRLFGLTPGTYYVSVSAGSVTRMMNDRTDVRVDYAPTYYPGTADIAQAQHVTVSAGHTLSGVMLSMVPVQTASVSGWVVDGSGGRASIGGVDAMPRGGLSSMTMPASGMIRADGSFRIDGLAPGEYVLTAFASMGEGGAGSASVATISVSGQDLTGIELRPEAPASLRGSITLDGGGVRAFDSNPPQLAILPVDADAVILRSAPTGFVLNNDLTFEAQASAGRLNVRMIEPDRKWTIKAVRYMGRDVTDSGFEAGEGQDLSGLEIELTSHKQEISGVVTSGNKIVSSYTAVFFPVDRELWGGDPRHIAAVRPDPQGRFAVNTLPPGNYMAVALPGVDEDTWTDPQFLDRIWYSGLSVSLRETETTTIALKLAELR